MLIGLTGTYCAGKNYTAAIIEERGLHWQAAFEPRTVGSMNRWFDMPP